MDPMSGSAPSSADRWRSRLLLGGGICALAAALTLLAARYLSFDALVTLASRIGSADGAISTQARGSLCI